MSEASFGGTEPITERLAGVEARLEHMATREDLARVEANLARVEGRLEHMATREDLARVDARLEHMATREDLASFEARILRWLISFLAFGSISLVVGVTRTFLA